MSAVVTLVSQAAGVPPACRLQGSKLDLIFLTTPSLLVKKLSQQGIDAGFAGSRANEDGLGARRIEFEAVTLIVCLNGVVQARLDFLKLSMHSGGFTGAAITLTAEQVQQAVDQGWQLLEQHGAATAAQHLAKFESLDLDVDAAVTVTKNPNPPKQSVFTAAELLSATAPMGSLAINLPRVERSRLEALANRRNQSIQRVLSELIGQAYDVEIQN